MPWGYVAAAAVGGIISSEGAKDAADTQAQAARDAASAQERMFERQVQLQEPWRQAGEQALNKLIPLATNYTPFGMQQYQADPGYQFRLQEGLKQLQRNAAARGGMLSGQTLAGTQKYAQGLASQEYQNAFNRYQTERAAQLNPLQSLAGVGQTSANTLSNAAQNLGTNLGEIGMQGANARASGYVGQANALTNALQQGTNLYMQNKWMNQMYPGAGSTGGYGLSSPQAQLGYQNATINPATNTYEVNF